MQPPRSLFPIALVGHRWAVGQVPSPLLEGPGPVPPLTRGRLDLHYQNLPAPPASQAQNQMGEELQVRTGSSGATPLEVYIRVSGSELQRQKGPTRTLSSQEPALPQAEGAASSYCSKPRRCTVLQVQSHRVKGSQIRTVKLVQPFGVSLPELWHGAKRRPATSPLQG